MSEVVNKSTNPSNDPIYNAACRVWGYGWFGVIRIRIIVDEDTYKTFWHFTALEFSFGISFPAFVVRWFETRSGGAK